MEKRNFGFNGKSVQVVDGRVVINSEELAKAIQYERVNLSGEEEADFSINFGCNIKETK